MRLITTTLAAALLLSLGLGSARADEDARADDASVRARLEALRDDLEAPGRTIAEAAKTLGSPDAALAFVRDRIAFVPYAGSWHDGETTLRLRAANAIDRAVLLRDLLLAMKQEVRIVATQWPSKARPRQAQAVHFDAKRLAALSAPTGSTKAPTTGPSLDDLRAEVARAKATIESTLSEAGMAERLQGTAAKGEPVRGPKFWAWVQRRRKDGTWVDLDPTLPGVTRRGTKLYALTPAPAEALIKVTSGKQLLASWKGTAAALFRSGAQVMFLPTEKKFHRAEDPAAVDSWQPQLLVAGETVSGAAFSTKAGKPAAKPGFNPFGGLGGGGKKTVKAQRAIRLEVTLADRMSSTAWRGTFGRDLVRFGRGHDPQQLVAVHRLSASVGMIPFDVAVTRQIDEILDMHDLRDAAKGKPSARALRGPSARSAAVVNALSLYQRALTSRAIPLGWAGPALVLESATLATAGKGIEAVARIDVWHRAFAPSADATRADRLEWGLATLATEGLLIRGRSVNKRLAASASDLQVLSKASHAGAVAHDEVAKDVLASGGVVLLSAQAPGVTWSLPTSADVLGTIASRGTTAKGGETRSQAAGRGFGALGGAAMGGLGAPSAMLVGGIAAYLNELAKAYGGATRVLGALSDTMATGDDKYILEAIGKYNASFPRDLWRALGEGAARGWAESAAGAAAGHALPGTGTAFGDRMRDAAVAGGLAYPEDLPVVSEAIRDAFRQLMD